MKVNIPKRKNKKERSIFFKILKFILMIFIILFFIGIIVCTFIYSKIKDDLSASIQKGYDIVSEIDDSDFNTRYPTILYDKDGNVLKEFQTTDYLYSKYEETNPMVFNALIAIEDERYYQHNGFDLKGFTRGIYSTLVLGDTQGGSTITQQLVKNIYLTNELTIWRKVSEAVIAQELEKKYSKDEILEFYINNVNYANGCYSFESAAQYYFQKNNKDLSLAEIAFITAIPNNPSLYNPLNHMENTLKRKDVILKKMFDLGMINQSEYDEAKNQDIILNVKEKNLNNDVSDYAQSYAIHKAVEEIMKNDGFQFVYNFENEEDRTTYWDLYNEEYGNARNELISGGYEIYTCIDTNLQNKLQEIVNDKMSIYKDVDETSGLYKKQASATIIDNKTGMVVAIVGGRTQDNVVNNYNRAYLAARQPGSSIKPLIVYTPSFENGYLPSDSMSDEPIANGPKNAGGGYSGVVSLRYAIEKSINTIAFRLCEKITPEVGINKLSKMHFRYLSPTDKESPIIALGGFTYGTNTLEMSSAYSALARNGEYIAPTNIVKIVKRNNQKVVYENKKTTTKIYDDGASYLMIDCMKGVLTSGTGRAYNINYPYAAAKTGTTNSSKDVWLCGCTPYYSMSVWVGDDTPSSQSGITAQGKIFQTMMNYLHDGLDVVDFEMPDSVNKDSNGILSYTKEKNENIRKERVANEVTRKANEIQKLQDRLNSLSYKLQYGLTEEEEKARETIAYNNLMTLRSFDLNNSNQFEELDKLLDQTKTSIEDVKDNSIYKDYISQYNSLKSSFDSLKQTILQNENNNENNLWENILEEKNQNNNSKIDNTESNNDSIPPNSNNVESNTENDSTENDNIENNNTKDDSNKNDNENTEDKIEDSKKDDKVENSTESIDETESKEIVENRKE